MIWAKVLELAPKSGDLAAGLTADVALLDWPLEKPQNKNINKPTTTIFPLIFVIEKLILQHQLVTGN